MTEMIIGGSRPLVILDSFSDNGRGSFRTRTKPAVTGVNGTVYCERSAVAICGFHWPTISYRSDRNISPDERILPYIYNSTFRRLPPIKHVIGDRRFDWAFRDSALSSANSP